MRNVNIYGVGDDVIDLGPLGKCPYPPPVFQVDL